MSDPSRPRQLRFATYNLLDMYSSGTPAEHDRHARVVEVIRQLDADVLAVQELSAPDEAAEARLADLAGAVGMSCWISQGAGRAGAVAVGSHGLHVGLLWREGITPVPGTWRAYGGPDFWHGLAKITLDVGGPHIDYASYHATPFGRVRRCDEAEQVISAIAGHPGSPPSLIGADWNTVGADRVPDERTGRLEFYDPDPYTNAPWLPDMIYQCEWSYDGHGLRRHWADRRPGDILASGGLGDAAALLQAPWEPTLGHWPDGELTRHGITARFDAIRLTRTAAPLLRGYHVVRTDVSLAASDHLPVVVEFEPVQTS